MLSVNATDDPLLFDLTVDLGDREFPYIYRAKSNVNDPIDTKLKNQLPPDEFFEKVDVDSRDKSVILEQGHFYIMKSKERLHIPDDVAVEVVAISERIGDIRIHYAGFAHPGFGLGERATRKGTPLIFEVRATDMRTKLYSSKHPRPYSAVSHVEGHHSRRITLPEAGAQALKGVCDLPGRVVTGVCAWNSVVTYLDGFAAYYPGIATWATKVRDGLPTRKRSVFAFMSCTGALTGLAITKNQERREALPYLSC